MEQGKAIVPVAQSRGTFASSASLRSLVFASFSMLVLSGPAGAMDDGENNASNPALCSTAAPSGSLVGTWTTMATGAPFVAHIWTFHEDGTMIMSGPQRDNTETNLSTAMGPWEQTDVGRYRAKFVEIGADRSTSSFAGTVVVHLDITVFCARFAAVAETNYYKPDGSHAKGPFEAKLDGTRITLSEPSE